MTMADEVLEGFSFKAPEIRRTPATFRSMLKVAAENWQGPPLLVRLPAGPALRLAGDGGEGAVMLEIRDFKFIRRILTTGDIGFAEGYIAGEWDTPDLPALLHAFSHNFDRLAQLMTGNPVFRALTHLGHLLRPNSRRGARRNIHAHYDLGNDFYGLWLDGSMTYSSGLYEGEDRSLEAAQAAKYAAMCDGLAVAPGDEVLEIGCGWGGFAEYAARVRGARVVALTISQAQWAYAKKRIFDAGLSEKVDVRLLDYRDVEGRYDKIASIEMFEAVGEAYWPGYFAKIAGSLKPAGRAGLQIITIADALFEGYRARPDFIQAYVFPGGMLPSPSRLRAEIARAGLRPEAERAFGVDYAQTLAAWAQTFEARWDEAAALGFDNRFRRLWRYYLGYCEAGFRTGRTDVVQVHLTHA